MPTTVTITERPDAALRRLEVATQPRAAHPAIGHAVVQLIRDHFHGLPPNHQNFPSTHFWQRAAEATRYDLAADGVEISINQIGVRQRLLGGSIVPKRGRFLTIPAIAETYGHTAADFGPLKISRAPDPHGYPTLALVTENAATDESGLVNPSSAYFWLYRSVKQDPNPNVLPDDDSIRATALKAVTATLK